MEVQKSEVLIQSRQMRQLWYNKMKEKNAESPSLHIPNNNNSNNKTSSKAGKAQVAVFTGEASVKLRKNSDALLEVIDSRSKNNPTSS